jgi:phospholipid/cholesterol/gamma-HCH transport system substrate-binding protein
MNQKTKKELQVGILFIVGLVMLIAFTIIISRLNIFTSYQYLNVNFDSVTGLKKGDPVQVSGLEMGDVYKMHLRQGGSIKVTLRLRSPIQLYEDYQITIRESSMLGGNLVYIEQGNPKKKIIDLKKGPLKGMVTLPGLTQLGKFVENNQGDLTELFNDLRGIAGKLSKGEGSFGKFINDDALYINLKDSSASLKKMLADIEEGKKSAAEYLGGDVYKNLLESTESLKKILKQVENGKGSVGKLVFDEKLSDQISRAGDAAVKILEPVMKTKVFLGVGYQHYSHSKESVSSIYIRIEPRETRYFLLGGSIMSFDAKGDVDFEDKIDGDNQTFIKPDVLLGYRMLEGTDSTTFFRAGLMEGKVGAGFDLYLPVTQSFISLVTFTLEGRDAYNSVKKENIDENLNGALFRFYSNIKFWNHFRLYAGASRVFHDPEFMVGVSFEYLDEDIKNFVTLLGLSKY